MMERDGPSSPAAPPAKRMWRNGAQRSPLCHSKSPTVVWRFASWRNVVLLFFSAFIGSEEERRIKTRLRVTPDNYAVTEPWVFSIYYVRRVIIIMHFGVMPDARVLSVPVSLYPFDKRTDVLESPSCSFPFRKFWPCWLSFARNVCRRSAAGQRAGSLLIDIRKPVRCPRSGLDSTHNRRSIKT